MKLYIKNMVCRRCVMAVQKVFTDEGIIPADITLGEVELEKHLCAGDIERLNTALNKLGFEIIDDRKGRIIERLKNLIINLVHHSDDRLNVNLSDYLAGEQSVF
jgi:hypothetical protein